MLHPLEGESTVSSHGRRDGRAKRGEFPPSSPFIRVPNLIHEGIALMTQSPLKVTPLNNVALEIKFQPEF